MKRWFSLRGLMTLAVSLLLAAGILSLFSHYGVRFYLPTTSDYIVAESRSGTLGLTFNVYAPLSEGFFFNLQPRRFRSSSLLGSLQVRGHDRVLELDVPYVCLLTALLPLLVGAFTGGKFRVWMWLAYVALIALLCACYVHQ